MKGKKGHMVQVMARSGADLIKLSSSDSPLMAPCGSVGPLIAKKVLDGNGLALIQISHVRMAIDTTEGVNALFDNFDLTDPHSMNPFLFVLLKDL
jgi:hypothetical protein